MDDGKTLDGKSSRQDRRRGLEEERSAINPIVHIWKMGGSRSEWYLAQVSSDVEHDVGSSVSTEIDSGSVA
ncbi:hypothetical protein AAE478_004477 [Parahypoxylon ruwenzoriense]